MIWRNEHVRCAGRTSGYGRGFLAVSTSLPGVTRTFGMVGDAAAENPLSRMPVGYHFRLATKSGCRKATALANTSPPTHCARNAKLQRGFLDRRHARQTIKAFWRPTCWAAEASWYAASNGGFTCPATPPCLHLADQCPAPTPARLSDPALRARFRECVQTSQTRPATRTARRVDDTAQWCRVHSPGRRAA